MFSTVHCYSKMLDWCYILITSISIIAFKVYISLKLARGNECSDDSLRLRGSSVARQGRVEICVEGRWGTVCDTGWDSRDAGVVCRQLGYPSLGKWKYDFEPRMQIISTLFAGPVPYLNAYYGQGSGPIWLDYLRCTGNETNLLNCSHSGIGITRYYCGHDDDVGVQCPGILVVVSHPSRVVMLLVSGVTQH